MKKFASACLAALCAISLAGCGGFTEREIKAQNLAATVAAREVTLKQPDDDFKTNYNDFALKITYELYKNGKRNDNACVSPLSIAAAFGMVTNGANGETKRQLENVLGADAQTLNEYFASLIKTSKKTETVRIANSVWSRKNALNIKNSFLDALKNYYFADYYVTEFDNDALNDINNWVYNNTRGGIEKALGDINDQSVMYLINALDFESEWQTRFDAKITKDQIFHGTNGDTTVQMMRSVEHSYISTEKASGFTKSYKDGYYFVGLLPSEGYSVEDVFSSLTGEKLNYALSHKHNATINLSLPKFDFECSYGLEDSLKNLGATLPFDHINADFSNLAQPAGDFSNDNLYIGAAIHKTHITVNEEKTKASAVTIVDVCGSAAPPQDEIDLVFDKPFVFMICDGNNLPLFIGATENIKK